MRALCIAIPMITIMILQYFQAHMGQAFEKGLSKQQAQMLQVQNIHGCKPSL